MSEEQTSLPLVEALRHEQRRQWDAGDRISAETYLQRHPELRADAEGVLELIYNEVVLRQRSGESPRLEEYQERFPHLAERLGLLFEVHSALEADSAVDGGTTATDTPGPVLVGAGELPVVPGFEILQEVGRGGMSVVYEARQQGLNRTVAVKMLLAGGYASREQRTRFRTEAEALGRLHHPHIVPVHEVGEYAGRPYLVMEYVAGGNLAQVGGRIENQELAAHLVETLARAVHYAHQRGIVHRDLKPANILLQMQNAECRMQNENPRSDSAFCILHSALPKITDFGLAKLLEDELGNSLAGGPTQSGAVLGTPSYMAPEQAAGQSREIGPAADVYALGAILYELLTGRPPFRKDTPLETLLQVQSVEPVPPSRLCPRLARDLATVCLKCLEKDPSKRFATADALADDLGRFLAGEPIRARPIGALERTWRWCRRKPLVASLAGALVLLVIGSLVGLTGLYLNADAQRGRAEGAEAEARAGEKKARQSEAKTKTVLEFLQKRILAAARPKDQQGGLGRDATIMAALDQAEPGIAKAFAGKPLVEASIRQALGHTYWFASEYGKAIRQHRRAWALRRAQLGPDDPDTLKSMVSLAQDYWGDGRPPKALELYQQVFELLKIRSGPNNSDTLWSMKGVADALQATGRLAEAMPLYEEALRRAKKALGRLHPDTLIYMDSLANAYRVAGRVPESIRLFKETLRLTKRKHGPNHPGTLITMNNFACAYRAAGRFDKAAALFRDALRRMKIVLPLDHRETLNTLSNLGTIYRAAGRLDKALPILQEAVARKTAKLGPDHESTLISMGELATAYRLAGRQAEALPLFEKTLRALKDKVGADSPFRLKFLNQTGACLLQMKKYTEAEMLLRKCLAAHTRKHANDWEVFYTKSQLGQALTGLKRYAEAEALLREAHRELTARRAKILGPAQRYIGEAERALVHLYAVWDKKGPQAGSVRDRR
jgi:serine/threonine protein kinase/tetratricopeptide (TPR) repeat protein